METDVVASEPMIISDNVDFEIDNQCVDIEAVEQILHNDHHIDLQERSYLECEYTGRNKKLR